MSWCWSPRLWDPGERLLPCLGRKRGGMNWRGWLTRRWWQLLPHGNHSHRVCISSDPNTTQIPTTQISGQTPKLQSFLKLHHKGVNWLGQFSGRDYTKSSDLLPTVQQELEPRTKKERGTWTPTKSHVTDLSQNAANAQSPFQTDNTGAKEATDIITFSSERDQHPATLYTQWCFTILAQKSGFCESWSCVPNSSFLLYMKINPGTKRLTAMLFLW